jgi:hypothetical protein
VTTGHALRTILAAMAATLLLAACGGSSGSDPSADQSFEAKRLAFFDCMRRAGLDVKEERGSGGETAIRIGGGVSPARLHTIQRDCARKTGGGPREPSKAEQAKFLDQALKFARCMRAHGVEMADPQPTGRGIKIRITGSSGEPNSPVFQRAQRECGSLNPKAKAGGGPSGQGASGAGGKSSKGAASE